MTDQYYYKCAILGMLWKARHTNPSLSVEISDEEQEKMDACTAFLKVAPEVSIASRPGKIIIAMVDQDGNAITPIENNEADARLAEQARKRQMAAVDARMLAIRVRHQAQSGDFSSEAVIELADMMLLLA